MAESERVRSSVVQVWSFARPPANARIHTRELKFVRIYQVNLPTKPAKPPLGGPVPSAPITIVPASAFVGVVVLAQYILESKRDTARNARRCIALFHPLVGLT